MHPLLQTLVRDLLREGMRTAVMLPRDVFVKATVAGPQIQVTYSGPDGTRNGPADPTGVFGFINARRRGKQYHNAYEVTLANAARGYGPLLYDVAMELATESGGGLMPDRDEVSPAAHSVWSHYMSRPGIEAISLLPWPDPDEVPGHMGSAMIARAGGRDAEPLMMRYLKHDHEAMNELERVGRLLLYTT